MSEPETILVVDDEPQIRLNMRAFLEDIGFRVVEAADGPGALAACARFHPQLVLLDINLPGMDGLDVCRQLKADPASADLPVIFVSAFLRTTDKVSAFGCGGVDYVTKPFQFEEVAARIGAHLEIHRQRRLLEAQHEALKRLEAQRDAFTHMMAHDMRGPLTGLMGHLELALDALPPTLAAPRRHLRLAQDGAGRVAEMISQMLELSRLEAGRMPLEKRPCDLAQVVAEAMEGLRPQLGHRRISATCPEPLRVPADPGLLRRILANLLGNACKFTDDQGMIAITVTRAGSAARIAVADDGPGIPRASQEAIFEKFGQGSGPRQGQGFGLGLAFCRLAVAAHGGEIGVESQPGAGSTFWFTLPGA